VLLTTFPLCMNSLPCLSCHFAFSSFLSCLSCLPLCLSTPFSPDHYYAVVIVDKRWTHLPKIAEPPAHNPFNLMAAMNNTNHYDTEASSMDSSPVEVVFTVKLGNVELLKVHASEPFDDGVFYFEAISQFKVRAI